MQRIGFDISGIDPRFKAHAMRGIGRYVSNLHEGFKKQRSSLIEVDFFDYSRFLTNSFPERLIDKLPYGQMTLKQQLVYPLKLNSKATEEFDILHFPAHMDAPSWSSKPYIITVLDLIPFILKELYLPDRPSYGFHFARWLEKKAIKNAALVLAISQQTANDVSNILAIPDENIRVTHLGIDERFFKPVPALNEEVLRSKYGLSPSAPLILYVGGIDQRKNWRGLLQLIAKLKMYASEKGIEIPQLCMSGAIESDRQFPLLQALCKELDIEDEVKTPGFIADEDLLPLYATASFFCFLSLYEGFGLPPLEAMAAGLPVLASNRSCMPEILGDSALLVDPEDEEQVLEGALALLEHSELSKELALKGKKQASRFTWEHTVSATLQAYESFATQRQKVANG